MGSRARRRRAPLRGVEGPRQPRLFGELAAAYGVSADGVPATFIGDRVWIGYGPDLRDDMRAALEVCDTTSCPDPLARLEAEPSSAPTVDADDQAATVRVPFVGVVELDSTGLVASTSLIALVDGFNPCSLWVLSILLALLLRTGSRRRLAAVGGLFLLVTALVYGLFLAGVFGAMAYIGYLEWIRFAVAGLALVFGAVNIKDYFRLKHGFSFTIPDRFKPRIYRGGRGLITADASLLAVLAATVTMALGVALVELPCTAGFPVVWSGLLADAGVAGAQFSGLLGLYLGVYLLDELVLLAVVVVTMRISRVQEEQGRVLKLVGGTIMVALAVVMALRPELMHSFGGTLAVFAAAVLVAAAIRGYERFAIGTARSP